MRGVRYSLILMLALALGTTTFAEGSLAHSDCASDQSQPAIDSQDLSPHHHHGNHSTDSGADHESDHHLLLCDNCQDCYSCSGSVAPPPLSLSLIAERSNKPLAALFNSPRSATDTPQRPPIAHLVS